MIKVENRLLCPSCFATQQSDNKICEAFCGYNESFPISDTWVLTPGTFLSEKYIIGRVLGQGGFGITYLAYNTESHAIVAIKEYFPRQIVMRNCNDNKVSVVQNLPLEHKNYYKVGLEKFYEEAKAVYSFRQNPNIIRVSEFFRYNGTAYYVMEYIEGVDILQYVKQNGPLSKSEVIKLLMHMINALKSVHSANMLHRDISPSNILRTKDGIYKLIDFGSAREMFKDEKMTVLITHGYTPIEQYDKSGTQGPWTDIYSLGATLYYALTARNVNNAPSRINNSELIWSGSDIDAKLKHLVSKMLAFSWEDRYQSVDEINVEELITKENSGGSEKADGIKLPSNDNTYKGIGNIKKLLITACCLTVLLISSVYMISYLNKTNDKTIKVKDMKVDYSGIWRASYIMGNYTWVREYSFNSDSTYSCVNGMTGGEPFLGETGKFQKIEDTETHVTFLYTDIKKINGCTPLHEGDSFIETFVKINGMLKLEENNAVFDGDDTSLIFKKIK